MSALTPKSHAPAQIYNKHSLKFEQFAVDKEKRTLRKRPRRASVFLPIRV
jgi:hypothetical protein